MRALLLAVVAAFGWAGTARASYIVTYVESGSDVVATGAGSINIGGLAYAGSANIPPSILPSDAGNATGIGGVGSLFNGFITGPSNYGPGEGTVAFSGTGDLVGLDETTQLLLLPVGYVSGSSLTDTALFPDRTFANLGLLPGTYVYYFGMGGNTDTFTVQIGPAATAVPEPASLALLGMGVAGVAEVRRRRAS